MTLRAIVEAPKISVKKSQMISSAKVGRVGVE